MNAVAAQDFAIVPAPAAQWLVLRCAPGRTLALAAALADRGAWTPLWKRRRRMPRSPQTRVVTEPCIPTFVFIPLAGAHDLPTIPRLPFSQMRFDGALVRIADAELEPLRKIAEKPLLPASKLPRPGQRMRFAEGPFQGLAAKVIACTIRYATVAVEGFSQPIQVPPCILHKI